MQDHVTSRTPYPGRFTLILPATFVAVAQPGAGAAR